MLNLVIDWAKKVIARLRMPISGDFEESLDNPLLETAYYIEQLQKLEKKQRTEGTLATYVMTHFKDGCLHTQVCRVEGMSCRKPGVVDINISESYDITHLGLPEEVVSRVLVVLNRYRHVYNDPTGDAERYLEVLDSFFGDLQLDKRPERWQDPFVQRVQEIWVEILTSESPGVVSFYDRRVPRARPEPA
jgi:hypothetical protein